MQLTYVFGTSVKIQSCYVYKQLDFVTGIQCVCCEVGTEFWYI
jgi:hypothetical protein